MYGLEAINNANGWSIAVLGVFIVFSGLVFLAIAISQIHKIIALWENRGSMFSKKDTVVPGMNSPEEVACDLEQLCPHPHVCPEEIEAVVEIWEPLVQRLDSPFSLADLHKLAMKNKFPHPHLTITRLRCKHFLVPVGDGLFEYNVSSFREEN